MNKLCKSSRRRRDYEERAEIIRWTVIYRVPGLASGKAVKWFHYRNAHLHQAASAWARTNEIAICESVVLTAEPAFHDGAKMHKVSVCKAPPPKTKVSFSYKHIALYCTLPVFQGLRKKLKLWKKQLAQAALDRK